MRRQRNKWKVKENREIKIWWYYLEIRTIVEFSIFEIFVISKCNVIHHLCYKTFCHLNRTNLCYIVQIISGTKKHNVSFLFVMIINENCIFLLIFLLWYTSDLQPFVKKDLKLVVSVLSHVLGWDENPFADYNLDLNSCNLCGKSFACRSSLTHHMRIHNGETACPVCGKVMSRKAHLRRHMKIHVNDGFESVDISTEDYME